MIDVMPQLQSQPQLQLQHQLHLQLPAVRHPCPITVKWSGEEGKTTDGFVTEDDETVGW
ncbi:uncharacterized protein Dana_GF27369, isoform A [Drosophila ananassae]|uniref:Uncharacterized protein, isoform A n=1 Tax=Drosophila ananassae TaxID=7217 RepID=A0A0P8XY18_DROAN|nr:uncharacterized protein Dana_GF27369, isoform A [Drosophila ananassae]